MPPTTAQQRLILPLAAVFLLDVVLSAVAGREELVLTMAGPAAMLVCVYYGFTSPGTAAGVASLVLVGTSALFYRVDMFTLSVGIESLKLSEVLAGGALLVLLAWRARPSVAILGTTALVIACLTALGIRTGLVSYLSVSEWEFLPQTFDLRSLGMGFLILVVGVGVGMYLRLAGQQRIDSELRRLVRRQWPLVAALLILLLLDIAASDGLLRMILLGGAVVAGVCAFFAPRAPVRAALTAAAAIGVAMLPYVAAAVFEMSRGTALFYTVRRGFTLLPFSLTQVAATMALIAFVVRYGKPQPAAWSTVALVAANLGGLIDIYRHGVRDDLVLPMGFLLVISVASGLYFRARDRERSQSVRVAVSGAQNAERLALARELHDVVAHHVTGIVVQAQAARMVATGDPAIAVNALEKIENSGTEALTAMRMLVGSLRGAEPAGGSTAATQATSDLAADIRALVEQFPGPTVHLELNLPDRLPHEMGRSVLRLVQESLTNVSKHAAGARNVYLGVSTGRGDSGDELHVFVTDDGTARRSHPAGGSGGYGLIGMRERVELLGGSFSAGPGADGGWVVKVALPLRSNN